MDSLTRHDLVFEQPCYRSPPISRGAPVARFARTTAPLMKIFLPACSWIVGFAHRKPSAIVRDTLMRLLKSVERLCLISFRLFNDPESHRNEIRPELRRQPVTGLREILFG